MESPQPSTGGGSGAGPGESSSKPTGKGMKRCPSCGAKNKDNFEYCVRCAEPLDEWAPEGHVAQGRAIQAKLFTGAIMAIGILLLFAALKAAVAPDPDLINPPAPDTTADVVVPTVEPILPDTTPKAALEDFREAVAAFNAGNYDAAIPLFQDVVRELPENPSAFQYLGLAYYHSGRFRDAMDALGDARRLRPDSFELLDHYVTAAKKGGELQAAMAELQDFLDDHPDSVKARVELARIARETGNKELAVEQAQLLAASGGSDPVFAYEYGVSLKEAGRLDEAEAAFRSAIELDPNAPAAHHALGVTELLSGDAASAVSSFEEAVAQAPTNGDFRFSLAQAYEKSNRISESLVAYEAYLEHARPDDPRARVVRQQLEVAKKALAERNQRNGGTS